MSSSLRFPLSLLALVANIATAHAAEAQQPGKVFRDCKSSCPEMLVLPAGSFTMGTPENEPGRQADEGPQHRVTFAKPFAISRYQVTAGEWDAYLRESGVKIADGDSRPGRECKASKPRYQQGPRQPAVCMSYHDVQAYADWLTKKTGKHYRMISEAEREYAARAGSSGPFPFELDPDGDYQISRNANVYGPKDGFSFSSPVGSYPANALGVYDMHGNVYEWVADCYHDSYEGAPNDGSAWQQAECKVVVIRGNDWGEAPIFSRSGNRNASVPDNRGDWIGVRLVREL